MRAIAILLITQTSLLAATFVGQSQVTFVVTEKLDGTTTVASREGTVNISLSTDYNTMRWSVDFNVDLLMSGDRDLPFETRLAATGNLTSRRCELCIISNPKEVLPVPLPLGDPSPFSFPDASGRAGAGTYMLVGTTEWTLYDRLANVMRERSSGVRSVTWSGQQLSGGYQWQGYGQQYLSIAGYPNAVDLSTGFSPNSWVNSRNRFTTSLGFVSSGGNVEVRGDRRITSLN